MHEAASKWRESLRVSEEELVNFSRSFLAIQLLSVSWRQS